MAQSSSWISLKLSEKFLRRICPPVHHSVEIFPFLALTRLFLIHSVRFPSHGRPFFLQCFHLSTVFVSHTSEVVAPSALLLSLLISSVGNLVLLSTPAVVDFGLLVRCQSLFVAFIVGYLVEQIAVYGVVHVGLSVLLLQFRGASSRVLLKRGLSGIVFVFSIPFFQKIFFQNIKIHTGVSSDVFFEKKACEFSWIIKINWRKELHKNDSIKKLEGGGGFEIWQVDNLEWNVLNGSIVFTKNRTPKEPFGFFGQFSSKCGEMFFYKAKAHLSVYRICRNKRPHKTVIFKGGST